MSLNTCALTEVCIFNVRYVCCRDSFFKNLAEILRKMSLLFSENDSSDSDEIFEIIIYFAMTRLNSWKSQRPTMCKDHIVMSKNIVIKIIAQ